MHEVAMERSRSGILIRALISVAGIAFFAWHFSRKASEGRFQLAGMISGGLLMYAAVAYILRPKYARRAWSRSQRQREIRSQLMFLDMCLWPGRFIAASLLNLAAMLCGKTPNHNKYKLDVTE
jgi:hypothetical protein